MSWLPPWVAAAPGGDGGAEAELSGGLPECGQSERTDVMIRDYRACLFNCRGMSGSLLDDIFLQEFVNLREGFYHILGFSEPQMAEEYNRRGFIIHHEPRRLRNHSALKGGFSIWLRVSAQAHFKPERLTENTPPESVRILSRDGSLFGVKSAVALIGAYVTNDPDVNKSYERKLGRSLIEELSEYIYLQRMIYNREVILLGDLNAYTGKHAGWDGSDAYFSADY